MGSDSNYGRLILIASTFLALLAGCVAFDPAVQSKVEDFRERPSVAVLRFGFDLEITKLSTVQTVEGVLLPEEEATQLAAALSQIQQEARWLLVSRLAAGQGFRIAPLEQTDIVAEELQLKPGTLPNAEESAVFRRRLGVDLVITGSILDYGKIRWQWLMAGMLTDMTAESIALGIATSWNPIGLGANVGLELLTSTPLWFGGGYLFGVAMRPVRVEARAFETINGYPIWQSMEESVYAWSALKTFPEEVRDKKELQLKLNLAEIIESLGDSLTKQGLRVSQLRGQSENDSAQNLINDWLDYEWPCAHYCLAPHDLSPSRLGLSSVETVSHARPGRCRNPSRLKGTQSWWRMDAMERGVDAGGPLVTVRPRRLTTHRIAFTPPPEAT